MIAPRMSCSKTSYDISHDMIMSAGGNILLHTNYLDYQMKLMSARVQLERLKPFISRERYEEMRKEIDEKEEQWRKKCEDACKSL